MKILFSPSKSQTSSVRSCLQKTTPILFPKSVKILTEKILEFQPNQIENIFKLSFEKSVDLIRSYKIKEHDKIAAIELFSGTSFREIKVEEYNTNELEYLANNLCILSAFYGLLSPLNLISPYRLDMNNNILKSTEHRSLYNFWSQKIARYFEKETVIINLASKEYSRMLKEVNQDGIINIHFLVIKNRQEKIVSVFSKQQRGKILDYIIKNQIIDPKDIKKYSFDGFIFHPGKSDTNNYYFIRH